VPNTLLAKAQVKPTKAQAVQADLMKFVKRIEFEENHAKLEALRHGAGEEEHSIHFWKLLLDSKSTFSIEDLCTSLYLVGAGELALAFRYAASDKVFLDWLGKPIPTGQAVPIPSGSRFILVSCVLVLMGQIALEKICGRYWDFFQPRQNTDTTSHTGAGGNGGNAAGRQSTPAPAITTKFYLDLIMRQAFNIDLSQSQYVFSSSLASDVCDKKRYGHISSRVNLKPRDRVTATDSRQLIGQYTLRNAGYDKAAVDLWNWRYNHMWLPEERVRFVEPMLAFVSYFLYRHNRKRLS